jgi:hypothetical protein
MGLVLCLGACVGGPPRAGVSPAPPGSPAPIRWAPFLHVPAIVDLSGPRGDGRLTLAAGGRLSLLRPGGQPEPFARGGGGYTTDPGPEPYLALSPGQQVTGAGCGFGRDTVYALQPTGTPGVISIDPAGQAHRVADLPGVMPNGITFDEVGRFGHRLLVTAAAKTGTTVFGIDCAGQVTTIAARAPALEGGIAVAPLSFGSFGGNLIAPDENTGRIWAFAPDGTSRLIITSPLPHGGDIGAESSGFVPTGFTRDWSAYVADRRSPGNPHPGTDSILRLAATDLPTVDVHPGDLLVASEAAALTIAVRCAATCTLRYIADGPTSAHVEGHIVFAPSTTTS